MNTSKLEKRDRKASLQSYSELKRRVEETLALGQAKIEEIKLQSYWDTGASINEHVRLNGTRAEYGKQVLAKLGRDIGLHETVLDRMSQFAEKFPDFPIPATWQELPGKGREIEKKDLKKQLTWSHFRLLITLEDDKKRRSLAETAQTKGWTVVRLADEIWKLKAASKRKLLPAPKGKKSEDNLLVPKLGKINTYRLVEPAKIHWPAENGLMFDRGFKSYTYLPATEVKNFRADEIVEVKNERIVKSERTARDLFTYLAYVDYVIDGDTLWVAIDAGLREVRRQKLRLRGIDAPEINTRAGKRAFEFLKATLAPAPFLILYSYKNDKFDRFETDLFIPKPTSTPGVLHSRSRGGTNLSLSDLVFVNNLLLERGFAVRVKD